MKLVRGLEDDSAGADAAGRPALKRLERPFLEDQELLVLMLVRRMRRFPGRERGDVNLELVERRRRRAHHLTDRAPVVRFRIGRRTGGSWARAA